MPPLGGVRVPHDFWWAYAPPVPLAGMRYPARFDWKQAGESGFGTVVCLTGPEPGYEPAPLSCFAVQLQDLAHGEPPDDPAGELTLVRQAVEAVTVSLGKGDGVVVHCAGGTGRSGTVIGAALVALGEGFPGEVAAWLDQVHRARHRRGWPESDWQRDVLGSFVPEH